MRRGHQIYSIDSSIKLSTPELLYTPEAATVKTTSFNNATKRGKINAATKFLKILKEFARNSGLKYISVIKGILTT
jgi:hypothetical protein